MKVAICVCVKNEEKELPYWIAWYSSLGVDSFIIYDDNSSDSTREVIKSLLNSYDIRFFRNFENKDRSVIRQCRAGDPQKPVAFGRLW